MSPKVQELGLSTTDFRNFLKEKGIASDGDMILNPEMVSLLMDDPEVMTVYEKSREGTKVCADCHGTGDEWTMLNDGPSRDVCLECSGKGRVKA